VTEPTRPRHPSDLGLTQARALVQRVTFLNLHLNIGSYQAIVAGLALVLTGVQNPDGITGTSTGKGPAVALAKLRDRAAGEFRRRRPGAGAADQRDIVTEDRNQPTVPNQRL
jgi:hypothetical protein